MSTIFSGTTNGTSGNTTVQVWTLSQNTGATRSAVMSVANGEETGTVNLYQYPKPTIARSGSGTIPASGGTVSFSVNSAYPFFFRNTPSNVSDITAGGQSYISGNVPAGNYNFSASIAANASTADTTGDIEMAFQRYDGTYSFNRPDAASFKFSFTQSGATTPQEDYTVEFTEINPDKEHQIDSYTLQNGTIQLSNGNQQLAMAGVNGDESSWGFQGTTVFTGDTSTLSNVQMNVDFGRMTWNDFMYPNILVELTLNNDVVLSLDYQTDGLTGGVSNIDLTQYASGTKIDLEFFVSVRAGS